VARRGGSGRGGGTGTGLMAVLDTIDENILWQWETYKSYLEDFWGNFAGNEGQMTILQNNVLPTLDEYLTEAEQNFPYSPGPDDLRERLYDCYDSDVMFRAFSDSIEQSVGSAYEYHNYSVELQTQHDNIMNNAFGGAVSPHATNGNWRSG